jgi:regulator of RNase E activity RraA
MVRIPAERVDEVADKAVAAMNTESLVRRAILDGVDPQDAYLRHRKF